MNATVYKISCLTPSITDCYIGVTKNKMQRKSQHKYNVNTGKESNRWLYNKIREHGGWDNWNFEILEEFPYDREIMTNKERDYIEQIKPSLNHSKGGYPQK
tara:strand:- start:573 stop:875 length:303 start_codon:yes stop_codon:yes gene_type:complete